MAHMAIYDNPFNISIRSALNMDMYVRDIHFFSVLMLRGRQLYFSSIGEFE
jgi:hypothetical protein